jgi:quercetin dioxygenase-like cupin family protein
MTYTRYYADETGASRTEDIEVELLPRDFAPPAPRLHLSSIVPATGVAVVRVPAGLVGDWHPTPRRQIFFLLAGELEGETSDGERRRYRPGSAALVEDTTGTGHRSRVVGDTAVLAAVVQLPD